VTAHTPDTIHLNGNQFYICERSGSGLFRPKLVGLSVSSFSRTCPKGYVCGYQMLDYRLQLESLRISLTANGIKRAVSVFGKLFDDHDPDDDDPWRTWRGLQISVEFSGLMLVGRDYFGPRYYIPSPELHHEVWEVQFERGQITHELNASAFMSAYRKAETAVYNGDPHAEDFVRQIAEESRKFRGNYDFVPCLQRGLSTFAAKRPPRE